jgi:hypothetical protein
MSNLPQAARHRVSRVVSSVRSSGGQQPIRRRQLRMLRDRVAVLEDEVQECRRLNRRVAELTDIVQELLVPLADRDEDALRKKLEQYSASL